MPTPIRQLLASTFYTVDASTIWNFSFAGGYIDEAHVKAYTETPSGVRTDLAITHTSFIGPFQLQITGLVIGDTLCIYRDTPKDTPLVNFTDESGFSEIALDTNARQAVFIGAESFDGNAGTSLALAAASAAQASAVASEASKVNCVNALTSALTLYGDLSAVNAAKLAAAASAAAALVSQGAAATSESNAAAYLAAINATLAAYAPMVRKDSVTGAADLPAGTSAQRPLTPATGATRINVTTGNLEYWAGSAWVSPVGATGGLGNPAFYEADIIISQDYTIGSGKNAVSPGPVTIATGKTVTVPTGSTWSIT